MIYQTLTQNSKSALSLEYNSSFISGLFRFLLFLTLMGTTCMGYISKIIYIK